MTSTKSRANPSTPPPVSGTTASSTPATPARSSRRPWPLARTPSFPHKLRPFTGCRGGEVGALRPLGDGEPPLPVNEGQAPTRRLGTEATQLSRGATHALPSLAIVTRLFAACVCLSRRGEGSAEPSTQNLVGPVGLAEADARTLQSLRRICCRELM